MRALKRIGFSLLALVGALLVANMAAAGAEWACYGTRWADGQPVGLYANHPGEPPRLRPGAQLPGLCYRVTVNADGFRGAELAAEKPANGLRLWFAGGSTTFDIYAPDDASTWPALAGAYVAAARPDRTVEVINAGVPAEILDGNTARLGADGPRLKPDVVVVYPGPNDLRSVLFRPTLVGPPAAWTELALFRSIDRWRTPIAARKAVLPAATLTRDQEQRLRDAIFRIVRAARTVGAQPVLATHALRVAPGASPEVAQASLAEASVLLGVDGASTLAAYDTVERLVRDVAKAEQAPLIDLRAVVPPDDANWGDATHFAAPGSKLAGEAAGRAIVAMLAGG